MGVLASVAFAGRGIHFKIQTATLGYKMKMSLAQKKIRSVVFSATFSQLQPRIVGNGGGLECFQFVGKCQEGF